MSIKIYLSGSTQKDNVGVLNYGTEEQRMQFLSDLVKEYIKKGQGGFIVYRNNGNMSLEQTIADSNSKKVDLHLALHSNAGGGDGTEIYYHFQNQQSGGLGKKLAQFVYDAVAPLTLSPDNGVKADNSLYKSGLAELRETIAPAALIEIMYHDNKTDVNDYLGKIDKIALAIAKAFYQFYGIEYKEIHSFTIEELIVNALASKNIIKDKDYWLSHLEGTNISLSKQDILLVLRKLLQV